MKNPQKILSLLLIFVTLFTVFTSAPFKVAAAGQNWLRIVQPEDEFGRRIGTIQKENYFDQDWNRYFFQSGTRIELTVTADDFQQKVKERLVYDKLDFDKDVVANAISAATNPDTYWKWEPDKKWVTEITKSLLIPSPSVKFKVKEYNDGVKDISEHTTKYLVKYKHDSKEHRTTIANTTALDVSVYKQWINFKSADETDDGKDEKPEYVFLMLMSKVQNEYADRLGEAAINIYTPCVSGLQGDLNVTDIPGVDYLTDLAKEGISSTVDIPVVGDAVATIITETSR